MNGMKSGYGEMTYDNGKKCYKGYFSNDQKHGKGELKENENTFDGKF